MFSPEFVRVLSVFLRAEQLPQGLYDPTEH